MKRSIERRARGACARSALTRVCWVALLVVQGCGVYRPTAVPMDMIRAPSGCALRSAELVVMLPGAHSSPDEFVDEGFVKALRSRALAVDVTMVDAHQGYYTNESMMRRLREDVVLPARAAGYQRIWLVGISLGGFTALGYANRHAGDIDGVFAIAPYPGNEALQREMAEAGGPLAWSRTPRAKEPAFDRPLWGWLAGGGARGSLPVYLGYGEDDRFAQGLAAMVPLLPAGNSRTVSGGHDWVPWRRLWEGFLERGLLRGGCAGAAAGKG